jgi:hypothetical protein
MPAFDVPVPLAACSDATPANKIPQIAAVIDSFIAPSSCIAEKGSPFPGILRS